MNENTMISRTREDSKLILANLPKAVQADCDMIFAAAKDFDKATLKSGKAIAISMARIDAYEKTLKESGFKSLADFSDKVFGMKAANASQFRGVGKKFFLAEDAPACADWYTVAKLYELRNVDNAILSQDCNDGILNPSMTKDELVAYAKSKALESGDSKASVIKLYNAEIVKVDEKKLTVTRDMLYSVTLDEIKAVVAQDSSDEARFSKYNPFVSVEKQDGDKAKTIACKAIFYAGTFYHATAKYFEIGTKSNPLAAIPPEVMAIIKTLPEAEAAKLLAAYGVNK